MHVFTAKNNSCNLTQYFTPSGKIQTVLQEFDIKGKDITLLNDFHNDSLQISGVIWCLGHKLHN